jgi:hypothetical protein
LSAGEKKSAQSEAGFFRVENGRKGVISRSGVSSRQDTEQ